AAGPGATAPGPAALSAARTEDPDRPPRLGHGAVLGRTLAVAPDRRVERGAGEGDEVGVLGQPAAGQRVVPEEPGAVPGRAADPGGGEIERPVGDAGVDVHAAVVVLRVV